MEVVAVAGCWELEAGILQSLTSLILYWYNPDPTAVAKLRNGYNSLRYGWPLLDWVVGQPEGFSAKAFKGLTHAAFSMRGFSLVKNLLTVGNNFRCFVLIHLDTIDYSVESEQEHHLVVIRKVAELGDHRVVLISKENVREKDLLDSAKRNDFWEWVEGLVCGGYLTDTGIRWESYGARQRKVPKTWCRYSIPAGVKEAEVQVNPRCPWNMKFVEASDLGSRLLGHPSSRFQSTSLSRCFS